MAQLTAPAQVQPPVRRGEVNRITARIRSTPGRMVVVMLVLLLVGLLAGIAWVIGSAQRSSAAGGARTGSGELAVQAQELYRALSDADATAAIAFLSSGVEPAGLRDRYLADIAAASAALAAVANGGASDKAAIQQISVGLPFYAALVDVARTNNRLLYPVGSAYLREASGLMRDELLPAAERLYDSETTALQHQRDDAGALPWLALLLGVGLVVGLIRAARQLSRQTHRTFNAGLLAATVVGVVMVLWNGIGWAVVAGHVRAANSEGSRQVELLAKARIAALNARADEALTLVARGSGAEYEAKYVAQLGALVNADNKSGLLNRARAAATDGSVRTSVDRAISDVNTWLAVHRKVRTADDGGDFPGAVKLAIGGEADSAATIFNRLDGVLASAIRSTGAVSDKRGADAAGAFGGQSGGGVFLTIVLLAGIAVGYQQRIAEYR